MLSDLEKEEMRRDAGSRTRRDLFRKMEKRSLSGGQSVENYLHFLNSIGKVFSSVSFIPRKTTANAGRL